jgi:hypothetical protein
MNELTAALTNAWPAPVGASGSFRLGAARAAFWRQLSYETRRHAGDDRLPPSLRERLRDLTRTSAARAAAAEPRPPVRLPRRWLRNATPAVLAPAQEQRARAAALAAGLNLSPPIAALSVEHAFDAYEPGLAFLRGQGYRLVRLESDSELNGLVLQMARVVVCDSLSVQRAATLADRPVLLVGAVDVFSGYPVRTHGLYLLRRAVDLDTGRDVPLAERFTEAYYRNLRNCGYRRVAASDVLDAVRELHAGVTNGWSDSEAQARFRARATQAAETLARRVPSVAEWGPDAGFLGDGRLARCQADGIEADGAP